MQYAIGVVGLGVMGANLARNIANRGFPVIGYDVDAAKVAALTGVPGGAVIAGADKVEAFLSALERPRRVLIMVPAGAPVDSVIRQLAPHLAAGDILIDGGNSHFRDTDRRSNELAASGHHFVGMGVSGGEEGALHGPSLMPGGPVEAWDVIAPIFRAIAARADDGEPCVAHMGALGAGHYVKMVHNGIEYADMQLIAETYDMLHRAGGMSSAEIASLFREWNDTELRSYLIEITVHVLTHIDAGTGRPLVELILDEAQQKGTGKWTTQSALDVGAPIPTITAAVDARVISAMKAERLAASRLLAGPAPARVRDREGIVTAARHALYAGRLTAYAQGMAMLRVASDEYGYGINPGEVARIWRAGCIIRAALLEDVRAALARNPQLPNVLVDDTFRDALAMRQDGWRYFVRTAVDNGIAVPAISASLAYYDAYRSERLPANLIQAQRDFFGAHTFRRIDRDGVFHEHWN